MKWGTSCRSAAEELQGELADQGEEPQGKLLPARLPQGELLPAMLCEVSKVPETTHD